MTGKKLTSIRLLFPISLLLASVSFLVYTVSRFFAHGTYPSATVVNDEWEWGEVWRGELIARVIGAIGIACSIFPTLVLALTAHRRR